MQEQSRAGQGLAQHDSLQGELAVTWEPAPSRVLAPDYPQKDAWHCCIARLTEQPRPKSQADALPAFGMRLRVPQLHAASPSCCCAELLLLLLVKLHLSVPESRQTPQLIF